MERKNVYTLLFFFCLTFLIGGLVIGGVQGYFWNTWDKEIEVKTNADKRDCDVLFAKNVQDGKEDFINYERAGEDKNVFRISRTCYKLAEDPEHVLNYRYKTSYFFRGIWWVILFIISSCVAILNYDDGKDEEEPSYY